MTDVNTENAPADDPWPRARLDAFRRGERSALAWVYRRHAEDVAGLLRHGFAFSSGGRPRRFAGFTSAFDLQDALHETFRLAFEPRARDRYDGLRSYRPYLRTIARNVVLQSFRAREVLFPDDDGAATASADDCIGVGTGPAHPERAVGEAQIRRLVDDFLETLDEDDRQLVDLRFRRGISQRDAAPILGLGRQQVRGREAIIRRQLAGFLRSRGELALVGRTALVLALWGATR